MSEATAKFNIGQVVCHRMFDYRGVVVDVDPYFKGSDDWYDQVASSKPPKDRPWYHVLVDGQVHRTYVAERNLEEDSEGGPVKHAELDDYFKELGKDGYVPCLRAN